MAKMLDKALVKVKQAGNKRLGTIVQKQSLLHTYEDDKVVTVSHNVRILTYLSLFGLEKGEG